MHTLKNERNLSTYIKAIHVLVSGTVQGVFFRKSTLQQALDLGLKGWVRNLEDGRVECKAIGCESDLLKLLHWMGKGPIQAKVNRVDVEWLNADLLSEVAVDFVIEASASL